MAYPGGNYSTSGPVPQGQPPRSPWSSPVVLTAAAAGVLLVIAGVLAAVILIPKSEPGPTASSPTTVITASGGSTITSVVTATPPATAPPTPTPTHNSPTVPSTDWQGFTDAPRCNASNDPAVAIALTGRSRVVICRVGAGGGLYYKGLADGNAIELQFPIRSGDTFTATNGSYSYVVSPSSLTITQGGSVLNSEPMIAFWSD